jgi:hypothetical protein
MAPPKAGRSTSRRNTPVSPPKIAGPVASASQPTGGRSTRSRSRDVSDAAEDQSNVASPTAHRRRGGRVPEPGESLRVVRFYFPRHVPTHALLTPSPVLDTVSENAEVGYPELNPSDAPDAVIDINDDEYDASSSAHSGITSYTQYELSKLDQESMANALPFLYQYSDSLLNLFSSGDAGQLERLHLDLQEPNSRASKKLNTLFEGFMLNRKHYGDDTPIDLDIAVRALAGLRQADEIPDGAWRPDAALYMANLAQYISSMYASNEESEDARDILASVFNSFPAPFGPIFHHEARAPRYHPSDLLVNDTLSLVLEIRTQYLRRELSRKHQDPAFDPDETLRAIFYVDHDRLRGPDYMDELSVLPSAFEAIFTKRITAIRRHFSDDISKPVDFDGLSRAFPYTTFLAHLARWAQLMTKQHKDVITAHGGISQVQSQLQDEFERRQSGDEGELMASSQSRLAEGQGGVQGNSEGTETTEVLKAIDDIVAVGVQAPNSPSKVQASKSLRRTSQPRKSLEWRAKQQQTYNQLLAETRARKAADAAKKTQQTLPPAMNAPAYDIQPSGDDVLVLTSPPRTQGVAVLSQEILTVLATLRKQEAQSNKENIDNSREGKRAFIDRQPGAERITFDSQDEISTVREKTSTKRKAPETDDDDDDDFEVDPRTAHPAAHRQVSTHPLRVGDISRGSSSKRARVERSPRNVINEEEDDDDDDEEEEEEEEEEEDDDNVAASSQLRREEANRNRHRSASNVPPHARLPLHERHDVPPSSSAPVDGSSAAPPISTQLLHLNRDARESTARRIVKPRQPQQRSRWTEVEVERLVKLIEDYGVSWSNLLRLDHDYPGGAMLSHRDQVSLKDKARNMKMDFLKYVSFSA